MKKSIVLVLLLAILFGFTHVVRAQSSLLFTVSPARQQITANPGEEFTTSATFYNQSKTPVAGLIKVSDFIVGDEKGTPNLVENSSLSKYSASAWIGLPFERISIAANDKVVVLATLKIPKDARPGGRYAAIYFEPINGSQPVGKAGASITPRIVSLLYIRVAGPISEYAYISNMFAQSFHEYGPIDVTAKIMNKGDYHIRPQGAFTLFNPLGQQIEQSKLKGANIFPETQYAFGTSIGQKWMMGKYKITLGAQYGSKEQFMSQTIFVWVFPWRVVTIVILSIIILTTLGRYYYVNFIKKEFALENELSKEKGEIEKLKKRLDDK